MINALVPLLDRSDVIGYAAAYDTRMLTTTAQEYIELFSEKLKEYGKPELDAHGRQTGRWYVDGGTEQARMFREDTAEWGAVEHDVDLMTVPASKAEGELTGRQMLAVGWLFDWDA